VKAISLSSYLRGKMEREGLQLGFATVDSRKIERGIRELAVVLEKLLILIPAHT